MADGFAIMLYCRAGVRRLHENPLRWEHVYHTVRVGVEDTLTDAMTMLCRFAPRYPTYGERIWIEPRS